MNIQEIKSKNNNKQDFLKKTIKIIFMYHFTSFIKQKQQQKNQIQRIVRADPELRGSRLTICPPKLASCSKKDFLWKTINIIFMYLLTYFIVQHLQCLEWIQN